MAKGIFSNPEERARKISLKLKGRKAPWTAKRNKTQAMRDAVSRTKKGFVHPQESRTKMSIAHTGMTQSMETRLKKSMSAPKGENNHNWKGGITPVMQQVRNCPKYKEWRLGVFKRDHFTCTRCKDCKGGNLNADHIKLFSVILHEYEIKSLNEALSCEELWDLDNGRTLCEKCHQSRPSWEIRVPIII